MWLVYNKSMLARGFIHCFSTKQWDYPSSSSSRTQWQIKIEGHQFLINQANWSLSKSYGRRHQQHLNFNCSSLQVHTKAQQTWTGQHAYWRLLMLTLQYYLRILIIKKVKFNKSILLIQINFATNTSIYLDGDKRHSHSK